MRRHDSRPRRDRCRRGTSGGHACHGQGQANERGKETGMTESRLSLSRRHLLRVAGAAGLASIAAACGATPQAPPPARPHPCPARPLRSRPLLPRLPVRRKRSSSGSRLQRPQIARTSPAYLRFNDIQTQYKVDLIHGKSKEAILTAVAAGTPPDVYWRWNVNTYGSWINKQVIQDITPFVDASTLDWSRFVPISLESCKWRGKYYGMPFTSAGLGLFFGTSPCWRRRAWPGDSAQGPGRVDGLRRQGYRQR